MNFGDTMRNYTICAIFLFALAFPAGLTAQTIGVKGGMSLSNMLIEDEDGTYSDDFEYRVGVHIGLELISPISDNVSFKSGLQVTTRGFHQSEEIEGISLEAKFNLLYLDIPMTMMLKIPTETVDLYGILGPYVGFGLTGTSEGTFEGEGISGSEKIEVNWGNDEENDDLRRIDYGLVLGGGVDFGSFALEVAYSYGLANISAYQEYENKAANRLVTVSVIYKIGI